MILLFGGVLGKSSVGIPIAERIESLKAGILAGAAFAATYLGMVLVNRLLLLPQFPELGQIPGNIWVNLAISPVSGFLFGVTYRYIIRTDENSHLKDGAVLAFGLVRGLTTPEFCQNAAILIVVGLEGLICFAITRFTLDLALSRLWLQPFR